jgi:glutaconate CoA-transferase subunit A
VLVAQPAITLDAALIHMNVADERGNAAYTGPDPYFDDLFCEAAADAYVSAERVVPSGELLAAAGDLPRLKVNRMFTTGVVEAPNGAHPTSCEPDHGRDEGFQKQYLSSAKDPADWQRLLDDYLALPSEAEYQAAIAARTEGDAS